MRARKRRWILQTGICLFLFFLLAGVQAGAFPADGARLPENRVRQIESYVNKSIKAAKIPGLILVIVKGDQVVYERGFGFADLRNRTPVTPETFFEMGSNSKAFTALGILRLQAEGKLRLTDPVSKYLPGFQMNYHGKKASITIAQLLHQTSGIPFESIENIPVSETESALKETVGALIGKELSHWPGESFLYATINYDVLGLIIQKVSGETFENYMSEEVLQPLGLRRTFLFRPEALAHGPMAAGYKTSFRQSLEYQAPRYRGNTPAGYFITNGKDLGEWLRIQLGTAGPPMFHQLIRQSQTPDYTVKPGGDGSFYGMGWFITQAGGREVYHSGANPNFSSFIILRPDQRIGVAVLTNYGNIESSSAQLIARGVMQWVRGVKPKGFPANTGQSMDNLATVVVFIAVALILFIFGMLTLFIRDLWKGERHFCGKGVKGLVHVITIIILLAFIGYDLYQIPDVMLQGFHWDFVTVWGPLSVPVAAILAFVSLAMFFLYYLLTAYFPKSGEKPYFTLVILSIGSALGNAFSIFTVYAALGGAQDGFATGLFLYFLLGMVIYVLGIRIVRIQTLVMTNDLVYHKRITMIDKILKASFQKIEALEQGKIPAGLNGDTEVVSSFINVLVIGITNLITLICCFVYLGILNPYALIMSIGIVAIAASLYYLVGRAAEREWEKMRDIQNRFFGLIDDLTKGFKELFLNRGKRTDFAADMSRTCETYRDKRLVGEYKFINVFVIGEIIFGIVIATVAFVFPHLFKDMSINELRIYIFIFLYMNLPVHGILGTIPGIFQFRISWRRINQLLEEISSIETSQSNQDTDTGQKNIVISLCGVTFQYHNKNEGEFAVGPFNADFHAGQITFITGGNGSGKSTLAKLITGLYSPDQGQIKVNGAPVSAGVLSQNYAAVFSDFHLFHKMYGIDYQAKQEEAERILKKLRIADKVQIHDGVFDTIELSTGQKKRLALLICFLENRPVFLFDEWAADQDIEFRKYFYQELLPELRRKGKCVIAITHDERYFGVADQLIKMELGQIVEIKQNTNAESGSEIEV